MIETVTPRRAASSLQLVYGTADCSVAANATKLVPLRRSICIQYVRLDLQCIVQYACMPTSAVLNRQYSNVHGESLYAKTGNAPRQYARAAEWSRLWSAAASTVALTRAMHVCAQFHIRSTLSYGMHVRGHLH